MSKGNEITLKAQLDDMTDAYHELRAAVQEYFSATITNAPRKGSTEAEIYAWARASVVAQRKLAELIEGRSL